MATISRDWLTHHLKNEVAIVTMNHPPANTLTLPGLRGLEATIKELAENEGVKVIIITGTGRFFSAGADIRMLADLHSLKKGRELAFTGQRIFRNLEQLTKPVIAAINGVCLGGGFELALSCHIRLAAENAPLGLPEINLGIIPGFGGTQRLLRLLGTSKATELLLTGDTLSTQEAQTLGLLSLICASDEVLSHALHLAHRIASHSQLAVRAALKAIHQGSALPFHEGEKLEAGLFGKLCDSKDKQEGVAAFLEKRPPQFRH